MKWKGFSKSHNTWQPRNTVEHLDLFRSFQNGAAPLLGHLAAATCSTIPVAAATCSAIPVAARLTLGCPVGWFGTKPALTRCRCSAARRAAEAKEGKLWEIEAIVGEAVQGGKLMYEAKWKDWPSSENTMQPLATVKDLKVFQAYLDGPYPSQTVDHALSRRGRLVLTRWRGQPVSQRRQSSRRRRAALHIRQLLTCPEARLGGDPKPARPKNQQGPGLSRATRQRPRQSGRWRE